MVIMTIMKLESQGCGLAGTFKLKVAQGTANRLTGQSEGKRTSQTTRATAKSRRGSAESMSRRTLRGKKKEKGPRG